MAISLTAKVGAASTAVAGGGATGAYFAWDPIMEMVSKILVTYLYEIEIEVLKKDSLLDVSVESGKPTFFFWKKENNTTKDTSPWSCTISIKSGSSISSDTKLKEKLPTAEGDKTNEEKQKNKGKLVRVCAKKRSVSSDAKKITSTLELTDIENEDKLIEFLFGKESSSTGK